MNLVEGAKRLDMRHNVSFRVIDPVRGKVVQEIQGHNASTNSLLTGIARYLIGNGILNQGPDMLSHYIPRYMSLGTMGLSSQEEDADGLPTGVGFGDTEIDRMKDYLIHCPGYGADGYDVNNNNNREYAGLGPTFAERPDPSKTITCELISTSFPRVPITYREVVPEASSELSKTVDIVFSGIISTGALAKFREAGKDYIFVSEAGLWSRPTWTDGGDNGLLAGYRLAPPDRDQWCISPEMVTDDVLERYRESHTGVPIDDEEARIYVATANRLEVRKNILRVGINQVVQVIWKIQLGGIEELVGINGMYPEERVIYWQFWD